MSQAQEISNTYNNLSKLYRVNLNILIYGVGGFIYETYAKEWNRIFSKRYNIIAPINDTNNIECSFSGDIIYSQTEWTKFEHWYNEKIGK